MQSKTVLCALLCVLSSAAPGFVGASVDLEGFGFEPPAPSDLFSFVGAPESTETAPRKHLAHPG